MSKQLLFNDKARAAVQRGVDQLADAVKVTLGPKGRNVVIGKKYGAPVITKDGVTVAKEIVLKDQYEDLGAQMVKEVASKTSDTAGDGTTTATVLAQSIYKEGLKNVTAGANPTALKRGIDKAVEAVIEGLNSMAKPIGQDKTEIEQVARISANGDAEIGKLLADAIEKVGKDGVITIEESKTMATSLDVVEGMQFDRGYISSYFVTDQARMEFVYEDAYVIVTDKKLSAIAEILPILQQVAQAGKGLLIIADDIDGEALAALIVNKLRGQLNVCCVKAPGFGDLRKQLLKDIAILTGTEVVSDDLDFKMDKLTIKALGRAKLIRVSKDYTTIVEGAGLPEELEERIATLRAQIQEAKLEFDKERLQQRLAKLSGGVAVIRVGAATELEMKEKKDRLDDALHATRAAIEEGTVPGGGLALLILAGLVDKLNLSGDELVGAQIVKRALEEPMRQIANNAGAEGSVVVQKVLSSEAGLGYNAATGQYEDLVKAGVLDPKKVTRSALQNAASVSGLLLTTEVLIVDEPEQEKAQSGMPQGMM